MSFKLDNFTDVLSDEICDSQPLSLSLEEIKNSCVNRSRVNDFNPVHVQENEEKEIQQRPAKGAGQYGQFRSVEEIELQYRNVFTYPYFNLVQSNVIEDALYSDKSMVVCAPTGSGKTVIFEMAIVRLLMEMKEKQNSGDFKIIYMAPVKALCTERLTEWYPKFTKLGLLCIEVTGDTDVDFNQLSPYRIIITTPEKWDMLTRRWRDHRQLVEVIKLFLIDEVHILNDEVRGPVLEAVVSRMKTIESSAQSVHRIESLQKQYQGDDQISFITKEAPPKIRFVAVSATVSNPEDVAKWLSNDDTAAVFHKFGDECRPVKLKRVVEGYACPEGASIFKFDIILSYKIWPIIQRYHNGKPTLIFCNTRKSVLLTAETLSREITISFNTEQKARLSALASNMKNKKLQSLILSGVGCHHAGLLFEERTNIEHAFRNRDLPILITTTTLAMGVNLPAHLVIIKNTQQYVNGGYQEYSISTILQMVGRAGRPQFDTEATAVIMTRLCDKHRYQALIGGSEPLQSYLHKRLAENLNSEAALGTVSDVAQCVQWLRSTFLFVRAARDPRRYLGLPQAAPQQQISKKIEELCVKAMNGLATTGLITMDEASCIESTEAGRLMSIFYLDLETMKHIMKVNGNETLDQLLWVVCESHELSDMHLRVDERRYLNALNRNQSAATIRFPMKGKITTRQMKLYCVIQAILGCLPISDPSLNQEAMKIMRIADRVCKCLLAYVTIPNLITTQPKYYSVILNSIILAKCVAAHLWENSPFVSKQLKGIGPTFSTLLATAGKVNFMLLEESHPRDLERIMNKGAPAGNVLRKQVSLLPKYQLTMTPIDQKMVSIQLDLLNCNYLMENIEQLTAGSTHKCYVVVGDSENHILLLTSFNDNTLINIYNGTVTYEITRIHNFEHKIFAHCISSTIAGVDVQAEYNFTSLEPYTRPPNEERKNTVQKQTTITDTFKERKRKNTSDTEIAVSKEKKKRDSMLMEKFKNLKESFGKTSNDLKYDLYKTAQMSNDILLNIHNPTINKIQVVDIINQPITKVHSIDTCVPNNVQNNSSIPNTTFAIPNIEDMFADDMVDEDVHCEESMNDDKINDILNEIENEILHRPKDTKQIQSNVRKPVANEYGLSKNISTGFNRKQGGKNNLLKSNYNFIDLLERNVDLDDKTEEKKETFTGFSENIKGHINDYLSKLQTKTLPDKSLSDLLEEPKAINAGTFSENPNKSLDKPNFYKEDSHITEIRPISNQSEQTADSDIIIENSQNNEVEMNLQTGTEFSNFKTIYSNDNALYNKHESSELYSLQDIHKENAVAEANITINDDASCSENNITNNSSKNNAEELSLAPYIVTENAHTEEHSISNPTVSQNNKIELNDSENINDKDAVKENKSDSQQLALSSFCKASQLLDHTKVRDKVQSKIVVPFIVPVKGYTKELSKQPVTPDSKIELSDTEQQNAEVTIYENNSDSKQLALSNFCIASQILDHAKKCNSYNLQPKAKKQFIVPLKTNAEHSTSKPIISPGNNIQLNNKTTTEELSLVPFIVPEKSYAEQSINKQPINPHNNIILTNSKEQNDLDANDENESDNRQLPLSSFSKVSQLLNNTKLCDNYNMQPKVQCQTPDLKRDTGPNSTETTHNKDGFKKYSYSTTKIDVITNEKSDHILHVIRKLKIDLDVTEIPKAGTYADRNNSNYIDNINKPTTNTNDKENEHISNLNSNEIDGNEFPELNLTEDIDLSSIAALEEAKLIKSPEIVPISNEALTSKYNDGKQTTHESSDTKVVDQTETETQCTNENIGMEHSNILEKTIGSVLQKYSEMMRKNKHDGNFIQSTPERNKINQPKTKRPFSIRDIENLCPNLSETTVKPSKALLTSNLAKTEELNLTPRIVVSDFRKKIHKENTQVRDILDTMEDVNDLIENENNTHVSDFNNLIETNTNIPDEFSSNNLVRLDEMSDYNIDQSMFNPKTLLQSLSNDDENIEIVPPPPEFSDLEPPNANDSLNFDNPNILSDIYEPIGPIDWLIKNNSTHENFDENDFHVELTPSKEIEVWNLSQENSLHEVSLDSASESTSVRRGYSLINDYPSSAGISRHSRLKEFKYANKNKLKRKF